MRSLRFFALVALIPLPLLAQQDTSPLRKSDLVRFLTGTTYTKSEVASIVRRSCLAFVPTSRDRQDLRQLGADEAIFHEIDVCVRNGNRVVASRTPPAPPEPVTLTLPERTVSAVSGNVAYITADIRRGERPVTGKRLVLRGATNIEGGARNDPMAVTDERGRAMFAIPAGTRAGRYSLIVAAADGSAIDGDPTVTLTTLPASPALASVTPGILSIGPGARDTRTVTVSITDPFDNPVPRQSVELRPSTSRPGLSPQTRQTSDSGTARFDVPTAPLRDGDSLVVSVGGRALAALHVSAAAEISAQMLEAERRLATQQPGAEAAYDSVLAVDPNNVNALIGRGYVRSWSGKYDAARTDFQAALRGSDAKAAALTGLGYNSARRGDFAAAVEEFQQALRDTPNQPAAATGLAYAELWQHEPHQAAGRSAVLSTPHPTTYPAAAAEQFRTGVEQLMRRDFPGATRSFSSSISTAPTWADAYYNRALAYEAAGRSEQAISDYEHYLKLRPTASNRAETIERIDALGRTPNSALVHGLIFPGLGQFYTRRPALGLVVMGGVAGGTVWALSKKRSIETRIFLDPFQKPDTDHVVVEKRPHLAAGIAAAGAVWVLSALEASLHASGGRSDVPLPTSSGHAARAASRFRIEPLVAFDPWGAAGEGPTVSAGVTIPLRFH
jgi:tetratricopeptide (TPR) repeat protein